MRKRPMLWTACVFLTGLAYERFAWSVLLGIPVGFLVQELLLARRHHTWKKCAGRSLLLLSAFLFGCGHMQKEETFRAAYLSKLEDGNEVTIWGEIKSIDTTEYGVRCILTDSYIRIHEEDAAHQAVFAYTKDAGIIACNDIMVYTSSTHYQVGQIHRITGQCKHFSTARNQGNFDYRVFYQSQQIDFIVEESTSQCLGASQGWIKRRLLELRTVFLQVFQNEMSSHAAGFYAAMVFGDKSNLSETTKDLFAVGGISHILAISGLHVSIIGRGLYKGLRKRRMSFFVAGLLGGIVLLLYCLMVGGSMSAVRAVGMMLLYFLAQYWGSSYDMLNSLGTMCLLLLWENPFLLEYSGFWFSVMALLGVGCTELVKEAFVMSVGITLSTLPVLASGYYEIPLYATFVNMIALPFLGPVFLLAVLGAVTGVWLPMVAHVLFLPCGWLLAFYEWLCTFAETLPGALIICGKPLPAVVVLYYGVLVITIWYLQHGIKDCGKREKKSGYFRKKIGISLGVSAWCLLLMIYPKPRPFEISFLDVGQGDGIYISTGDGTTCFIDGGSTSVHAVGEYRILPFLKSKGVASIDYWFVTHADADHISGLLEVLSSGYKISHLVIAEGTVHDENSIVLLETAEQNGTQVHSMKAGEQMLTPQVTLTCLYAGTEACISKNDASLVLMLEYEDFQALFTGDISSEIEKELIRSGVLSDVDLYKAAHHGSKHSNSAELLEVILPEQIVISCSENNIYGHPAPEAVSRMEDSGAEIFYTMKEGQITFFEKN